MRGPLLDAARLVPIEQAERRVLVLRNPGLGGAYATTATLFAGLQIILPGETAPSHHHTPAALRLIVEGRGAFTTVDGVKCVMEPGDLIITPPMRWHDHGHDGAEPVIWLDGLDIPLVRSFDAAWASKMRPPAARDGHRLFAGRADRRGPGAAPRRATRTRASRRCAGRGGPCGARSRPWRPPPPAIARRPALRQPADRHLSALYDGRRGAVAAPGERTPAERRTASAVFHVIEGRGESKIGDERTWEQGDCVAVPPWHWVQHQNLSASAPACLFHFNDEPAVRALGLWQEETR